MKQAMELKLQPLIIPNLLSTNVKLHFLSDGLSYDPNERPSMISMFKIFRLCLNEGKINRWISNRNRNTNKQAYYI